MQHEHLNCYYYSTLLHDFILLTGCYKNPLADPTRHIKKKQLRDISHKIRRVQLRMHSRKAKRDIPEVHIELNSLLKQRDNIRNGNVMRTPNIPRPERICPLCNNRIGKGYHICKPKSSLLSFRPQVQVN